MSGNDEWPIPEGLSDDGRLAAEIIRGFLTEKGLTYHGGGSAFYTPQQWAERGERWGKESLLVITHDGGEAAVVFNWDYSTDGYALREELDALLKPHNLFYEAANNWYTAVYYITPPTGA